MIDYKHNNFPYQIGDSFNIRQDKFDEESNYAVTITKRDGDKIRMSWIRVCDNDGHLKKGTGDHELSNIRECLNTGEWTITGYRQQATLDEDLFVL